MARFARVVLPGVAHHVSQRGNRQLPVFFSDDDRRLYCQLLLDGCARADVVCLAWCLMDNHVHLILVPRTADGLRAALGEAHRRYTRHVNLREGWRGHLFQARFASYPMDDAHLLTAIRYVENNPVAAGLVRHAEHWRWSSAHSRVAGWRGGDDVLTDLSRADLAIADWGAMLRHGWEAGVLDADGQALADAIEARLRTGRPLAAAEWIAGIEKSSGRTLAPQKRGPKPKQERQL
jgi:putative transposase